mmetsp:Transcript_23354/g.27400  ORF Transcript_23354/g.27400 Transcript_23354/m.27400 type:complete len:153 (+) Transcript_23354:743-1201(+)
MPVLDPDLRFIFQARLRLYRAMSPVRFYESCLQLICQLLVVALDCFNVINFVLFVILLLTQLRFGSTAIFFLVDDNGLDSLKLRLGEILGAIWLCTRKPRIELECFGSSKLRQLLLVSRRSLERWAPIRRELRLLVRCHVVQGTLMRRDRLH